MSRDEWVAAVARQIARTMPDQFPEGFALYTAEQYAAEGGYDRYVAGEYPDDLLWAPKTEGVSA